MGWCGVAAGCGLARGSQGNDRELGGAKWVARRGVSASLIEPVNDRRIPPPAAKKRLAPALGARPDTLLLAPPSARAAAPPTTREGERAGPTSTDTLATLGPIARSSVVDAVAERVRDEILSGRLAAGSKLPSEREFSLALGVNRLTLRAALARLEAMGLIVTRHGAATLVANWRESAGLDALPALLSSSDPTAAGYREVLTSLLELRRILAAEAVALAAERHTEEDVIELEERARDQVSRVDDPVAFARGDIAFERAVVRAARNVGLELLLNTFARFPDEQPDLVAALFDRPEDSARFYPLVIDLVRAGDPARARDMVRGVLEAVDAAWHARHAGRPRRVSAPPDATERGTLGSPRAGRRARGERGRGGKARARRRP